MVSMTKLDEVFVLDLGSDDNIFDRRSMDQILVALDSVSEFDGRASLLTVATGKSWTTGFDREWMVARASDDPEVQAIIDSLEEIVNRLLRLPVMSIAAIQGHCFAAGAIFAMAHDVRIMRSDRGYFCLPEVDLQIPFTKGLAALLQMKLPTSTAFEAMLTGRRYGGTEAFESGIVDRALPLDELLDVSVNHAKALAAKSGNSMQNIRMQLSQPVLDLLHS